MISGELTLRPITHEDTPLIVMWRNNPRVRASFLYRETFTAAIHEEWIRRRVEQAGDVAQWIAVVGDEPIGSVYLRDIDWEKKEAEYGVFIGEDHAVGRGYGKAMARAACGEALSMGLRRLFLRVFIDNIGAIKSYEAAGFQRVGFLPMQEASDGERKDMYLMERILC